MKIRLKKKKALKIAYKKNLLKIKQQIKMSLMDFEKEFKKEYLNMLDKLFNSPYFELYKFDKNSTDEEIDYFFDKI